MGGTTRVSSKGQVVIPAWARRRLGLGVGEELTVEVTTGAQPVLVLKRRSPDAADDLLARGYAWLERSGEDPVEALHEARRRARFHERGARGARRGRRAGAA